MIVFNVFRQFVRLFSETKNGATFVFNSLFLSALFSLVSSSFSIFNFTHSTAYLSLIFSTSPSISSDNLEK